MWKSLVGNITEKGGKGDFLGTDNVLLHFLDAGYTIVFTLCKVTELDTYNFYAFLNCIILQQQKENLQTFKNLKVLSNNEWIKRKQARINTGKNHRPVAQIFDIPTFENLDKMEKIYTLPKMIKKKIQLSN